MHEHHRIFTSGSCFTTAPWRELTPYELTSVMHCRAPRCSGVSTDYTLSSWDDAGAAHLHGPPLPAVVNWGGNSAYSDLSGWGSWASWGTIRFPDITGDGRADVCGRDAGGIYCGTSDNTTFVGGTARSSSRR